jgi:Bacterial SH3 domain
MNKSPEPKKETRPPRTSSVSPKATRATKPSDGKKSINLSRATKPVRPTALYQAGRSSKRMGTTFLVGFGALVVLVASYAVYISTATRKPWLPAAANELANEQRAAGAVRKSEPVPTLAPPANPTDLAKNASPKPTQPGIHPNAVVDVPRVSLRKAPDVKAKVASGYLRRGELVEIVGRNSGRGAPWVKIRTRTGIAGWVFASVVREHRRG